RKRADLFKSLFPTVGESIGRHGCVGAFRQIPGVVELVGFPLQTEPSISKFWIKDSDRLELTFGSSKVRGDFTCAPKLCDLNGSLKTINASHSECGPTE